MIFDGSFPNKHVSSHLKIMICGLAAFLWHHNASIQMMGRDELPLSKNSTACSLDVALR